MTNDLTRGPTDNFTTAAEAATSLILGERVRFSKGPYYIGRGDSEQLPAGTQLHAIDIQAAWIKFVGGNMVDRHIGYPMYQREELDDIEEQYWPLGKPKDPWSNQRYLYLIDPETGAEYTFITSNWGGRAAVESLARKVYVRRAFAPGAIAIVQLNVGSKKSPRYGVVPAPLFKIVGWASGDSLTPPGPAPDPRR
jgi:hypothetical protein